MSHPNDFFRLNVGFIVHENVGYTRDFPFEFPFVHLPPDLDLKDLTGVVRVTRTTQGLLVQVKLRANVLSECVRCLTDVEQPLEADFTELYAFSPKMATDSGLVVPETGKIDLAPLVRDEMILSMPISPLCSPDCKGLCPVCGENLNEREHTHEEEATDPRLDALKTLREKGKAPSSDQP